MKSVTQLAQLAGVSRQAILQAISSGRLAAEKAGEVWIIDPNEAARFVGERNARNRHSNIQKKQEK